MFTFLVMFDDLNGMNWNGMNLDISVKRTLTICISSNTVQKQFGFFLWGVMKRVVDVQHAAHTENAEGVTVTLNDGRLNMSRG